LLPFFYLASGEGSLHCKAWVEKMSTIDPKRDVNLFQMNDADKKGDFVVVSVTDRLSSTGEESHLETVENAPSGQNGYLHQLHEIPGNQYLDARAQETLFKRRHIQFLTICIAPLMRF
jgi:hydrogenase maturation factor